MGGASWTGPASAALAVQSDVCGEMVWICDALINSNDVNTIHTNLPSARWRQFPSPCRAFIRFCMYFDMKETNYFQSL